MFRKTTSNKEDKPSLWKELYHTWEDQINILHLKLLNILRSYPKTIYASMVSSILLSIGCFFYLPKKPNNNAQSPSKSLLTGFSSGIGNIASSASAAKELLELQSIVENLVHKDSLTQQDSVMVLYVFERMQKIENSIIRPKVPDKLTQK